MDRDNLSPRAQIIGACVDGLVSHLETIVSRIAGLPSHAGVVAFHLDRWVSARSENVLFSIICFLMSSFVFDLARLRECGAPEWAQSFPVLFVARSMACTIRWNVLHAYLSVACLAIAAAASSPQNAYVARRETPSRRTRSPSLSVRTQSRRFRSLGTASAYASGSSESTSAPAPESSPHIPSPFEHVRHLGSGASGVVHLVRNTTGAKGLYAMKVVKNDADGYGLGELAMLKHLTALKLEYITPLYYEVHDASDIYMFMAYKPRGTLVDVGHRFFNLPHRQYMAHCTELFKRYAIQIVHAVAGLHDLGIMHRDIKPDNILVDERGDLFLSDFGFAKEFTTRTPEHHVSWDHRSVPTLSARLARLSQLPCGTPGFMAPEVLVNNPQGDRWYGFEADWYSVGATLFEVFSGGQLPYVPHGRAPLPNLESGAQFYEAIYAEELEFPSDGPWGQLPVIRNFLELLLEVNPAERLGTAEDVMRYPVFANVDWSRVRSLQLPGPLAEVPGMTISIRDRIGKEDNFEVRVRSLTRLADGGTALSFYPNRRQEPPLLQPSAQAPRRHSPPTVPRPSHGILRQAQNGSRDQQDHRDWHRHHRNVDRRRFASAWVRGQANLAGAQ